MNFASKKLSFSSGILVCCMTCLLLAGCGYVWRGEPGSLSENSVLGNGNKTLKLVAVEQPTLYTWLSYAVRSQIRDDITARGLARWVDDGEADYTLTIKIPSFQVRSYGEYHSKNLLYVATINIELIISDGRTNTETWRSGPIYYSDTFQSSDEESAIKTVISTALQRCVDRLQQRF